MKNICIINTGGTIGMRESRGGLQPEPGYLESQLEKMYELSQEGMPAFDVIEYQPLLDSSNMTPSHWLRIATDIEQRYSDYDGFVVLHGTDTMAYTSSALPFMLQGLGKSVVLTGAQLPLGQIRNDARENLKTAMILAANHCIPEVTLFFGEVLLRGCRATKVSASKLDAFDSPNYPPLGSAETVIEVFRHRIRQPDPSQQLSVCEIKPAEVATFRLFPGMSIDVLSNLLRRPLRGLVIESYGQGNGPANNKQFLNVLENAVREGTVILNCTQCSHGCVIPTHYATGTALHEVGVVSGHDMTIEAALAKLLYLFSCNLPVDIIKSKLLENLVGELTPHE
jgi:L-asparaginase